MTIASKLGIWMDHSTAHLIEFTTETIETSLIHSTFTHEKKEETLRKSENVMHNKEQHHQLAFYKKLEEIILQYEAVLLFGPTDAKIELLNLLRANHHFDKIHIEAMQADKMTENQEHAFVREYFSKPLINKE